MPERMLQVVRTYTTWWQTWLMTTFVALLTGVSGYLPVYENNRNAGTPVAVCFALGLPALLGCSWLAVIAKWQFAHCRARLIPGYRAPHLAVLAVVLTLLLVVNPVGLSMTSGQLSPVGALAFTLLLGGASCWSVSANRQFRGALVLVLFFSAMTEMGNRFWFVVEGPYTAIHGPLLVVGTVLVVGWLWHLARLHEEMDDYQRAVPWTGWSSSRWERTERERIVGRQAARAGVIAALADRWRWHDRLQRLPASSHLRPELLQYGFGRIPGAWHALFLGLGFAVFDLFLFQLRFMQGVGGPGPSNGQLNTPVLFALLLPTAAIGLMLQQRLPRLGQELLRPASREAYFNALFWTLAKQAVLFWLALQVALAVAALALGTLTRQELGRTATTYILLSLALQLPAFAWCLWVTKRHSMLRTYLGIWVSGAFQFGVVSLWWWSRQDGGDAIFSLLAAAIAVAGWLLIRRVRQSWLNMELG